SLPKRIAYRVLMRRTVMHARRLISVSSFVATELRAAYGDGIHPRLSVIGEGVDERFRPRSPEEQAEVRKRYDLSLPFFLYVGNAKEHKNVPLLIEAFRRAALPAHRLVLVTGGTEAALLPSAENVCVLSGVDDEHLPALYSAAAAFVTASLYEGYGLPAVEAAACGSPVIAARTAATPETAPAGALLLPPTAAAFAEGFRRPPLPSPFAARRWEAVAADVASVFRATFS
ncbi:MAG: glycosyltransferase family 1 protein, partial [Candidatus Peribacteraceae bacterium]|nr:glycosyltransferase family 1 protein [Candidatus Peribacteraceae bacterium]